MTSLSTGALAGLRVIDLSRVLGGPYCSQYLADHGADVIKIEPPQGDETRNCGPPKDNRSAYFAGVNRNKRNAAIDPAKQEGKELLLTLLETADVLLHNFKSGTLERWELGYDNVLSQRFPRLICCQITGFGDGGPLGGLPGYDAVIQAMSGLMSVNGSIESGPMRIGVPLVDIGSGLQAVAGILMALSNGSVPVSVRRSMLLSTTVPCRSSILMSPATCKQGRRRSEPVTSIQPLRRTNSVKLPPG